MLRGSNTKHEAILTRLIDDWKKRVPGFTETVLVKQHTIGSLIFFRQKGANFDGVFLCQSRNKIYLEYADNLRLTDGDGPFIGDYLIECNLSNISNQIVHLFLKQTSTELARWTPHYRGE